MFLVDAYRVMAEKGAAAMLQQPGRRVMTDKWQVAKAPARRQSRRSGGFATASAHDLHPHASSSIVIASEQSPSCVQPVPTLAGRRELSLWRAPGGTPACTFAIGYHSCAQEGGRTPITLRHRRRRCRQQRVRPFHAEVHPRRRQLADKQLPAWFSS